MLKIGFDVAPWKNKAFRDFTNEELLEYYYKLRLCNVGPKRIPIMEDYYVVDLQDELIRRLSAKDTYLAKIAELRDITWGMDIASPTCPEYIEHHEGIQKILAFIDKELLKEDK